MPVRLVEGQLPYTGGEGISIDENKVISLNLRDENNLIIYDSGDDEIYVDLQLPAGIKPNYAFPVGITTGRVLVADDWDVTGTIIVAKTTSGDVIKLLYGDDGTLWMDNGTGLYKQIYFKGDVDVIIQSIQTQIDALSGLGKFLSLWNGETGLPISFPLSTPYEYHTGDWFMINVVDNTTNYRPDGTEFDGTASTTVETSAIEIGDVYIYDGTAFLLQKNGGGGGSAVLFSQVLGDPYSNTNLASALNDKQDELIAGTNINIDSSTNTISATDTTYSAGAGLSLTGTTFSNTARFSPDSAGTQGQVLTKGASGYDWATVSGGDVQVSTDTGNLLTTGVKLWLGDKADFDNLGTLDSNTIYAPAIIKQIFYYDFRGKTGTNLTTDGWTLQTGSRNFDANGIYNTAYSANDIHISIPATGFNFTRASKITVSFTGIFTNRSAAYIGICQSANAVNDMIGCTDINAGYGARGVFSANNASKTSDIAITTGTHTETFEADVVNKTLKLSIPSYTDATGTILDADLGIVSSLSYFYVHIRGLGSKTTISDLTVIVE